MKKIISLFAFAIILFSVQSCKRNSDTDGNLLNDMDANQGGLTGKRALFRETKVGDTLTYYYTGYNLTSAIGTNKSSQITYNGNQVDKINYMGFVGTDLVNYIRTFNYDSANNLSTIVENKNIIASGDQYKSEIQFTYKPNKNIDFFITKIGKVMTGQNFIFTNYERTDVTYAGNNIAQLIKTQGVISSTGQFVPSIVTTTYKFDNYDTLKSPYTLLPSAYLTSQMVDDLSKAYKLSPNNPKKSSFQTHLMASPTVSTTTCTYDPQDYLTSSFNVFYQYKPF